MTLIADGVTFRYPGPDGFRLPPTDLAVREGLITAVLGPSGSGKSTLAQLLAGTLTPETGTVTCDGQAVERRRGRLPGHTALLDQDPLAAADPRMTLRRTIALPARLRRLPVDAEGLAGEVGLDPGVLDRLPHQVSGGQLHRACLARASAQRPRYLIADEVTAHLDPETTAAVARVLRSRAEDGLGVLVVTHDRQLVADLTDAVHEM